MKMKSRNIFTNPFRLRSSLFLLSLIILILKINLSFSTGCIKNALIKDTSCFNDVLIKEPVILLPTKMAT